MKNRAPTLLLMAGFLCGLALLVVPPAVELAAYRTDAEEYAVMAEQVRPPGTGATPTAAAVFTTQPPQDTEFPASPLTTHEPESIQAVTCSPTVTSPATAPPSMAASAVDLVACAAQNKDFVAWLTIPGTVVDYPVVRSDNTAYYLHHLFSGKESKLGCLFSLTSSDYATPSRNIAIYGHHLSNSNAMFSTLMDYKQASYYADHSLIRLDTLYGTRTYRIFAVVNMKVSDWDAATVRFASDEDFLDFVNRAKNKALYDTGVAVESTDNILTLITCDRSHGGASGRLIVMAVQELKEKCYADQTQVQTACSPGAVALDGASVHARGCHARGHHDAYRPRAR